MRATIGGLCLLVGLFTGAAYAAATAQLYVDDGALGDKCLVNDTPANGTVHTLAGSCAGLTGTSNGNGSLGAHGTLGSGIVTFGGATKPGSTSPTIDVNTSITNVIGTTTFTVRFSDSGFTISPATTVMSAGGYNGSSSSTFTGFFDPTNTACTAGPCGGTVIGTVTGNGTVVGTPVSAAGPFSLTEQVVTTIGMATDGADNGLSLTPSINPPSIQKSFNPVLSIPVGGTASLSFTITNPNAANSLSGLAFTDPLPAGLLVANPNGASGSCGGTVTAMPGSNTITLANGSLAASSSCTFSVNLTGISEGVKNNLTSQVNSIEGGLGNSAAATLVVGDVYQVRYLANLNAGDSFVDVTNTGGNGGIDPVGDICANVYVFAADQQLIACCSCPLTPNHLKSLSGKNDLINNTLTTSLTNEISVGLLVTANPTGNATSCNPANVMLSQLTVGLGAYATTLHALPGGDYGVTETKFSAVGLSAGELSKLTQLCGFIQADGSGYGICGSCEVGAAGAKRQ